MRSTNNIYKEHLDYIVILVPFSVCQTKIVLLNKYTTLSDPTQNDTFCHTTITE